VEVSKTFHQKKVHPAKKWEKAGDSRGVLLDELVFDNRLKGRGGMRVANRYGRVDKKKKGGTSNTKRKTPRWKL